MAAQRQADGKWVILVAEDSWYYGFRGQLVRLNRDGSLDPWFSSIQRKAGPGAIALQADGRLLVAGLDTTLAAVEVARYDAGGYKDASFQPGRFELRQDPNQPEVGELEVEPDGTIVVGGRFNVVNGIPATNHVRLRPDGSVETSFTPDGRADHLPPLRAGARGISSQPDGRRLAYVQFNFGDIRQSGTIVRLDLANTDRPGFELSWDVDALELE